MPSLSSIPIHTRRRQWQVTADVRQKYMRNLFYPLLVSVTLQVGYTQDDAAYQRALERAMRDYPPGDYEGPVVKRFYSVSAIESSAKWTLEQELLSPVEVPKRDIGILSSEAARYFSEGRWDLAIKRNKQILLVDPENVAAKASLYDILKKIAERMQSSESKQK